MEWQSIAGQLAQIGLPALGTLFGGPLGGAVGGIVGKGVAAALGVAPTPEAVSKAIADDPTGASIKLAEIEAETKRQDAYLADIANARAMNIALAREGGWAGKTPAVLSYLVLAAMIGMTFALFFVQQEIPERLYNLLNQSYGALILALGQVLGFWLGSSRRSETKDAQIQQLTSIAATRR